MHTALKIPPVVKTVYLDCSPAEAFRAFTDDFDQWWPHATHSLGRAEKLARVVFEGGAGGRLYEIWNDGSEHVWGRVLVWNPPDELAFSWHVGHDPALATEVHLAIRPERDGSLVELTHRNWEILGQEAETVRTRYESGWSEVFERCYADFTRRRDSSG